jgi:hypothetical protein
MNWVFISPKTTFFIVTAMKTSNLTGTNSVQLKMDIAGTSYKAITLISNIMRTSDFNMPL